MEYSPSKGIQVGGDMKYVDRGDPTEPDFELIDLTIDGANHPLDLSSIVPSAGANHLVHIYADLVSPDPFDWLIFSKNGNSGPYNVSTTNPSIPNQPTLTGDIWVMMDADRKIQYKGETDLGFASIVISIRGWLTD